jgi:hypothetical protein
MQCFRHSEKLLDALFSLTEIFRLVSYKEHVPYALLNPAHGAPRAIRERPYAAATSYHYRHRRSAIVECIKQRHATSTFGSTLLTDFVSFLFAVQVIRCSQHLTSFHRQCHRMFTSGLKIKGQFVRSDDPIDHRLAQSMLLEATL